MSLLHVQQKKGDPESLDGRLTVYAQVDLDVEESVESKHPVASMIHNGLLVAQGNFKEQYSLRDFLKSEMGVSLEEGLEQLLSRLDGLESALDPQKLKDKLQEMEGMEDFLPTPAKIVPFHSEDEILAQDGDVFFLGRFRQVGSAVLSVNAFPILYQARFREQALDGVRAEIDRLVSQIERPQELADRFDSPEIDVAQRLIREFIPNMLYCRKEPAAFEAAEKMYRAFMSGYRFAADIEAIVQIIKVTPDLTNTHYKQLELYARKIAAVQSEDFAGADRLRSQIADLERQAGASAGTAD